MSILKWLFGSSPDLGHVELFAQAVAKDLHQSGHLKKFFPSAKQCTVEEPYRIKSHMYVNCCLGPGYWDRFQRSDEGERGMEKLEGHL